MRSNAALTIVALVVLGACNTDGVTIEVHRGDTRATRVELYVVDGYCSTDGTGATPCPQLKTPSAPGYLAGEVYTREIGDMLEAPVESDGVAYFTIKANGDHTRIPLAVAVGFDGDTRVGAVLMPFEFYTTDNNRHIVTLDTIVEDKVDGRAQTDGLRAETWYKDPVGCLALELTSNGTSDRKFIVPADDLDCDGWLAPQECDSIWPDHGPNDDSTLPFTCLAEDSSNGVPKRCLLGRAPCVDGNGPPECRPVVTAGQQWCVPSALCDPLCGDDANPSCLYNALRHPTMPPLKHPTFVHCKVPVQVLTTAGNNLQVCRTNLAADIDQMWTVPAPTSCTGFGIGQVTATQIGPFMQSRITAAGPTNMIRTDLLQLQQCVIGLTFAGEFEPNIDINNALIDYALKLDMTNGRSLVVPLVLSLEPVTETECQTANAQCFLEVADTMIGAVDVSLDSCVRP